MKKHRSGYTTGACATAAAVGSARMLKEQHCYNSAEIILPTGEHAVFNLIKQSFNLSEAKCSVIKDAGTDPDVTNGAEISALVRLSTENRGDVRIFGGEGVGRVTKPGLAVSIGEPAINPVPRKMIIEGVSLIFKSELSHQKFGIDITISIPEGEKLAKKTLNERLGVIGGLSVLGTTGIVVPVSSKAWMDTIDTAIDVALACGCDELLFSTGRTSEQAASKYLEGDEFHPRGRDEAFILMGDYVGHSLKTAAQKGVKSLLIAGQFAKILKIACRSFQTHVSNSSVEFSMLSKWIGEISGYEELSKLAAKANTAREVLEKSGFDPLVMESVCSKALQFAQEISEGVAKEILLAGYDGKVIWRSGSR